MYDEKTGICRTDVHDGCAGRGTVGQVWVDGVFMGQMFLTAYGRHVGDADYCFDEAARQLRFMSGMHYLPEKGLLLTNWQGHGAGKPVPHMLLVDRQKRILHAWAIARSGRRSRRSAR